MESGGTRPGQMQISIKPPFLSSPSALYKSTLKIPTKQVFATWNKSKDQASLNALGILGTRRETARYGLISKRAALFYLV